MGIPSFPPSGRVVSLMETLEFKGLEVVFGYLPSDAPNRRTHSGGYKRRVSV